MKKILLIITGSIACYKTLDLIRMLKKQQYQINCILTKSASQFITPLLVSSLTGNQAYQELFQLDEEIKMGHIKLAREHDLIVIAPASADFIAKLANGNADDLASCTVLASDRPIYFAPAMNEKMWINSQTQQNINQIINHGLIMIEPETDILACLEYGIGKMAKIETIFQEIEQFFALKNSLAGKKILLTAGSTREKIDDVRFIGNNSSGKQALALVKIFRQMNADLTVISGNLNHKINLDQSKIIEVENTEQMMQAVIDNLREVDVFIGCAAVADFRVKNIADKKIKKQNLTNLILELELNPDILSYVGHCSNRPKMVIGFCAESENLLDNAKQKLLNKNCDLIIANHLNHGKIFGSDFTQAILVTNSFQQELPIITKNQLASIIANQIISFFSNK